MKSVQRQMNQIKKFNERDYGIGDLNRDEEIVQNYIKRIKAD